MEKLLELAFTSYDTYWAKSKRLMKRLSEQVEYLDSLNSRIFTCPGRKEELLDSAESILERLQKEYVHEMKLELAKMREDRKKAEDELNAKYS